MNNKLKVVHLTTEDVLDKILYDGKLLPKSCIADLAKHKWLRTLFLLPKSFTEKGIYGIFDFDIGKWKNDTRVWEYLTKSWIQAHGKNSKNKKLKKIAKISFEITEKDDVYVLEENVLFVSAKKFWDASFWGQVKLLLRWRKIFVDFVDTKVKVEKYNKGYVLPSVFIKNEILTDRIVYEIINP